MQLNFARSVTGAKQGTSHQFIYNETQWPKLSERQQDCKKIYMSKVVNNLVPPYVISCFQLFKTVLITTLEISTILDILMQKQKDIRLYIANH